jgi:NOL1/NOP2/sun family putative RNA methylase
MRTRQNYEPKPLFLERMQKLLGKDMNAYMEFSKKPVLNSIRCNTLKISPEKLLSRLKDKGWKIEQPFKENPEIMIVRGKFADEKNVNNKREVNNDNQLGSSNNKFSLGGKELIPLEPGELGRSLEHLLGYYYVQEIASMLSVLALQPKPGELVLDLCASPGSKTTQIAAEMKNTGTIIANEVSIGRLKILASNTERCGVLNSILTKRDGIALCKRLKENGFSFDKILVDAPCSGEGTIRSSPATYQMWNPNTIKVLSRLQKSLLASAIEILKPGGELVYSTCTHAPEENEGVIDFILKEFGKNIGVEKISLPVKCRPGIKKWEEKNYDKEVEKSCRIYPQDNNTEGFFIAKIRRVK